jgi:hypothetical protein
MARSTYAKKEVKNMLCFFLKKKHKSKKYIKDFGFFVLPFSFFPSSLKRRRKKMRRYSFL